ncbi:MAG: hypothetical protein QM831_29295 [Kofleriaceae bacterium]
MVRGVLAMLLFASGVEASPGVRAVIDTPSSAYTPKPAAGIALPEVPQISPYLYLNRCVGGCTINGGSINDARQHDSTIPPAGTYQISEFANDTGMTGAAADDEWAAVVQCMKEVYSPYGITVTDVKPDNVSYTEAVIAGQPGEIGRPVDNLGVAPIAANCEAEDNVMSFSFANHHGGSGDARIYDICWTAAQESAHAFGLDHEYVFTDGSSTCRDPMTYRDDCGGEKFFRNFRAQCGEYASRACRCGGTQNSHAAILKVFGAATPITMPPHVMINGLASGAMTAGAVHATAGAQRGVAKVELFLNGSRWAVVGGAPFSTTGQPDADYALTIPETVPNSIVDVMVRATDDLGISTDSDVVTATRGSACTDVSQCLADQSCTDGKCAYPAPVGELGAECPYAQYCMSWECVDTDVGKRCVEDCEVDEPSSCPANFTCQDIGGGKGLCVEVSAGCCSVGGGSPLTSAGLTLLVMVCLRRRRR